jgi:hypothetical protein
VIGSWRRQQGIAAHGFVVHQRSMLAGDHQLARAVLESNSPIEGFDRVPAVYSFSWIAFIGLPWPMKTAGTLVAIAVNPSLLRARSSLDHRQMGGLRDAYAIDSDFVERQSMRWDR